MTKAKIVFQKLILNSQEYGTNDEHMVSRIFFSIQIDNSSPQNTYADIKQPAGSNFETAPLEVSKPNGYEGAFNYSAFRDEAEKYYRSLIGSSGLVMHITGSGSSASMKDFNISNQVEVEFEIDKDGPAW